MAEKVKLSKDGSSIDFVQSESLPTSVKKFRQSPEIEGFYRFIFENDLQKEAYEILNRIIEDRKLKKAQLKKEAKEAARMEKTVTSEAPKKQKLLKPEGKIATKLIKASAKPAPQPIARPVAALAPAKQVAKSGAKPVAAKSTKPAAKTNGKNGHQNHGNGHGKKSPTKKK